MTSDARSKKEAGPGKGGASSFFDRYGDRYDVRPVWKDRLSRSHLYRAAIADLLAQCSRCKAVFGVEITGTAARWIIEERSVERDSVDRSAWKHRHCNGRLRFFGQLPSLLPRRIVTVDQ